MKEEKAQHNRRSWWRIEGDRFLLSSEATARFYGVTSRTLRDWTAKGCPQEERGWYDPAAIMRWRNGEGRSGKSEAGETLESRKLRAETEYRERKAERERIFLEAQLGLYMERAQVESEWAGRIIELKAGLLAMGRKVAANIADPVLKRQAERVINNEIHDLLDQYARTGTYTPRPRGSKKTDKQAESDCPED